MSDPKGQSPCDACHGSGTRANETLDSAAPTVPVDVLARELDLLELEN